MSEELSRATDRHWRLTLEGEAVIFPLLGKALYVYGDRTWFQSLVDENIFSEIPFGADHPAVRQGQEELKAWSEKNRAGISDSEYDALCADYTSLFVAPLTSTERSFSPPWESFYFDKDHLLFHGETMRVRSWYRSFGLEPEKLNNEPDDHIALELSFIGYLAGRACLALKKQDFALFQKVVEARKNFFNQHLLRWGPSWCKRVSSIARTSFYRGVAKLTEGVLYKLTGILHSDNQQQ
jgi:TorA maturation chaperone TorD